MNSLSAFHNFLNKIETMLSVVIFVIIVIILVLQLTLRFSIGKPIPWAEELPSLLLIYLSFIAADVVYKGNGHINIDHFYNKLSNFWQILVSIISYVLIFFLLISILPKSITLIRMQSGHTLAATLPLHKGYWTIPVPIAFASMIFTTFYYLVEEIKKLVKYKTVKKQ